MKRVLAAQEIWLRNKRRKFITDRIKNVLLLLALIGCFLAAAWVEIPY